MSLPIVVVYPPPTPNGRLHIGHVAGPFLRADLYQRLVKSFSRNSVISVGHIDTYQSYVPKKARESGMEPEVFLRKAIREILEDLQIFDIKYDLLIDNQGVEYRTFLTAAIDYFVAELDLYRCDLPNCAACGQLLYESNLRGNCPRCLHDCYENMCENCCIPIQRSMMLKPHCAACQGEDFVFDRPSFSYRTEVDHRIVKEVYNQIAGVATEKIKLMHQYLGSHSLPLFFDCDYGFKVQGYGVLNPWVEVHFAQLYSCFKAYGIDTSQDFATLLQDARNLGKTAVVPFFGIDNSYLFGFLYPWISIRLGLENFLPSAMQCSHFLLRNGTKFSSSRNNAIWARELVGKHGARQARSILAVSSPEGSSKSLAEDEVDFLLPEGRPIQLDSSPDIFDSVLSFRRRIEQGVDPQVFSVTEIISTIDKALRYAKRLKKLEGNTKEYDCLTAEIIKVAKELNL